MFVCVPVGTFLCKDSFMFNHWELSCGGDLHKVSILSLGACACYKYRVGESFSHFAGLYPGSVSTLRVWPMLDDLLNSWHNTQIFDRMNTRCF